MRTIFLPLRVLLLAATASSAAVRLERVPESGLQPQVATGGDGTVHLVYLKGPAQACDVRYVHRTAGASEWSQPVTVNSRPGSAIATGTIRGAQIAAGPGGSVHVVWNGAPVRAGEAARPASPLFYARLVDGGSSFTTQRDLLGSTRNLDGGASVAADGKGRVFIVWHGAPEGGAPGETGRVVFVLKSADNGATFAPLKIANEDFRGVCACCSLKAFVSPDGRLRVLYRAARSLTQRDMTLLSSGDDDMHFTHETLHPWETGACPMSSMAMTASGQDTRAAWETGGRIYSSPLGARFAPLAVSGEGARHPSLAVNSRGETLIAWSVGTGWQRGGGLAWTMLDAAGRPGAAHGSATGVPVWSHCAVFAEGDSFVVLH